MARADGPVEERPFEGRVTHPNQDRPSGPVYRLGLAAPCAPSRPRLPHPSRFSTGGNPCCWQRALSHRIIPRKTSRIEVRCAHPSSEGWGGRFLHEIHVVQRWASPLSPRMESYVYCKLSLGCP